MEEELLWIKEFASRLELETCSGFHPGLLAPEERIRAFCLENKCGNYGSNYMCPPHVGSLEQIRDKLEKFQSGVLLRYSKPLDVRGDREGVIQTKVDFHKKILQVEGFLAEMGIRHAWGMIGGSCGLCEVCRTKAGEACPYPDKARSSLEANAIDVLALLDNLGLDNGFHADRITWTGCIIYP